MVNVHSSLEAEALALEEVVQFVVENEHGAVKFESNDKTLAE